MQLQIIKMSEDKLTRVLWHADLNVEGQREYAKASFGLSWVVAEERKTTRHAWRRTSAWAWGYNHREKAWRESGTLPEGALHVAKEFDAMLAKMIGPCRAGLL